MAARYLRAIVDCPDCDEVMDNRILAVKGGQTAELRRHWNLLGLEYDLMGLNIPRYIDCAPYWQNLETGEIIDGEQKPDIDGNWKFYNCKKNPEWSAKPRIDHRHHAMDAITVACANRGLIQKMAEENDVLICVVGATSGKLNRGADCAIGRSVAAIRPCAGANRDYIYYGLHPWIMRLRNSSQGSAIGVITKDMLDSVEMPFPKIEEQSVMVQNLKTLEKIINQRKSELQLLDTLIKARFVEMFGDPIINSKNKDTQDLKDVLVLKAGDFTAASDISEEPTETNIYPCYGGNGIRGYVADYNQEGEYSLVGRQGALSGNVQYAEGKFRNTEHALLVTPIIEMNSIWLNQLLINLDLKRYQTGAAQPGLSVKNLQEIPIIMVSIDEQNRYADFVKQVDKSKVAVKNALDQTKLLFESLMQRYFG